MSRYKKIGVLTGVFGIFGGILGVSTLANAEDTMLSSIVDVTIDDSLKFQFESEKTKASATLNASSNLKYADVNIDKISVESLDGYSLVSKSTDFTKQPIDGKTYSLTLKEKNHDLTSPYSTKQPLQNLTYEMGTNISSTNAHKTPANIIYTLSLDYHEYNITYNPKGGTMPSSYPRTYTYDTETILPTPAKEGYEFLGWNEEVLYTYSAESQWEKTDDGWKVNQNSGPLSRAGDLGISSKPLTVYFTLYEDAYLDFIMDNQSTNANTYYQIVRDGEEVKYVETTYTEENVCHEKLEKGHYFIKIVGCYSYNSTIIKNFSIQYVDKTIPFDTGNWVVKGNTMSFGNDNQSDKLPVKSSRAPDFTGGLSIRNNLSFTVNDKTQLSFTMQTNPDSREVNGDLYLASFYLVKDGEIIDSMESINMKNEIPYSKTLDSGSYKLYFNCSSIYQYKEDDFIVKDFKLNSFVISIPTGNIGDKSFKANYEKLPSYNITYNTDGGTLPDDVITEHTGKKEIILPTPTKSGYEFVGWKEEVSYTYSAEGDWIKTDTGWIVEMGHEAIATQQTRAPSPSLISQPLKIQFELAKLAELHFKVNHSSNPEGGKYSYKIYKNESLYKEVITASTSGGYDIGDYICHMKLDVGKYQVEITGGDTGASDYSEVTDFSIVYSNPYDTGNWRVTENSMAFSYSNSHYEPVPKISTRAPDFPKGQGIYNNIPFTLNKKTQLSFTMQEGAYNPHKKSSFYLVKDGVIIDSMESVDMTNQTPYSKVLDAGEYKLYFETMTLYMHEGGDTFIVKDFRLNPFVTAITAGTQEDKIFTACWEKLPTYSIDYNLSNRPRILGL